MEGDKSHRGNASQFFIAGELCRRGYSAVVTLGNTPNVDILCSNREGTKFLHIQVKTYVPGSKTCSVGTKATKDFGESFFWILGGIPTMDSKSDFEYYIMPSKEMAKNVAQSHEKWLKTPGAKGQKHNDSNIRAVPLPPYKSKPDWDISQYRNNWELIEKALS